LGEGGDRKDLKNQPHSRYAVAAKGKKAGEGKGGGGVLIQLQRGKGGEEKKGAAKRHLAAESSCRKRREKKKALKREQWTLKTKLLGKKKTEGAHPAGKDKNIGHPVSERGMCLMTL